MRQIESYTCTLPQH